MIVNTYSFMYDTDFSLQLRVTMDNKFLQAMRYRHATKVFDKDKKIDDDTFTQILEMGRLSPSSFGFEPWKFLVVQDMSLRKKMLPFTWGAQGQLPTASHFMIILHRKDSMRYDNAYIQYMLKEIRSLPQEAIDKYNEFYPKFQKQDFSLLENKHYLYDWAIRQIYIALGNMTTGAAYLGVDSCPIEGFDKEQADTFVANELGIDTAEYGVAVMLSFGYRKDEQRPKTRQALEDIVTWYN